MKNKNSIIVIVVGLVIALGIVFFGGKNTENSKASINSKESISNSEIKDGVQYITINAKGGYSPRTSIAKSGIPTKLIVKTDSTFDCSLALRINSINYQKILPQTGEEIIDVGIPKAGEELRGVCSMGMYSFVINFE
jgi:plastocyanin domain-containing protein